MIVGIGVDITSVSRIATAHARFRERFARRILDTEELAEYADRAEPVPFLAKRFAIKEAAVKALGTGEREGVLLRHFGVRHDELGRPLLEVSGAAADRCQAIGVTDSHVSVSDEGDSVVAFVILERLS